MWPAEEKGTAFVNQISQLTGADVAASTDLTGSNSLGGDWDLETLTGNIEAPLAFQGSTLNAYNHVLRTVAVFDDSAFVDTSNNSAAD